MELSSEQLVWVLIGVGAFVFVVLVLIGLGWILRKKPRPEVVTTMRDEIFIPAWVEHEHGALFPDSYPIKDDRFVNDTELVFDDPVYEAEKAERAFLKNIDAHDLTYMIKQNELMNTNADDMLKW